MSRWPVMLLSTALAVSLAARAQIAPPQGPLAKPTVDPQLVARLNAARAIPANRPTLSLFVGMLESAGRDRAALRRQVEAAAPVLKVQRICHVFGGYSSRVACVSANELVNSLGLSTVDRNLFNMALNDLWERAGGAVSGGDINTCGGRSIRSVTNVTTGPGGSSGGMPAAMATRSGGKAGSVATQMLSGGAASGKVAACRSAQTSGMADGLGFRHVPGSPGYRAAVTQAQTFLGSIGSACRESGNGLIAADAAAASTGQPADGQSAVGTAGGALSWLAGTTTDLIGAMGAAADVMDGCSSPGKCVVGAAGAAIGLVADANDLVGNTDGLAAKIKAADTLMDVIGGVVELAGAATAGAGAVAVADAVLPGLAVFALATTIGEPVGKALANVLDPAYVAINDLAQGVNNVGPPASSPPPSKPTAGGGVGLPAEGGRSCDAMAQRAAAFNAYCSQPGNDWQSYDCMSFVARLNKCADPGLVQPVPGEDFQCSGRRSEAAKRQFACEQQERLRGMLSSGIAGTGSISRCAQLGQQVANLQQRFRQRICTQAQSGDAGSTGGIGGSICQGLVGGSSTNRMPAP